VFIYHNTNFGTVNQLFTGEFLKSKKNRCKPDAYRTLIKFNINLLCTDTICSAKLFLFVNRKDKPDADLSPQTVKIFKNESGAGTQQNPGGVILTAAAGDVLTLRNHTSAAAVTLQTLAGGTQVNSNASITLFLIGQ